MAVVTMYETTHARHDPAHCLVPGLFRSLKRGQRKTDKLDITYDYGNKEQIRFVGFEPLDATDLRLLQGLVALAGPNGLLLKPEPESEIGKQLRLFLEPQFDAVEQDGLVVKSSFNKLLYEVGLTSTGDNIKNIKESLFRLSNVTVQVTEGRKVAAFHLLSYALDEADGKLFTALNPRITTAILGGRHTNISMHEVRKIESDLVRLIHQRLCGWINEGSSGSTDIDTLCGYVYSDTVDPTTSSYRMRKKRVREAIEQFSDIKWTVKEYAKDKFTFIRPRRNSDETTS